MVDFKPAVIPVPSYLLEDSELEAMADKLCQMDEEHDEQLDERAAACMAAIRTELAKRGKPISL
jgi:hypothetical protein